MMAYPRPLGWHLNSMLASDRQQWLRMCNWSMSKNSVGYHRDNVCFMPQDYGNGVTEPFWFLGMLSEASAQIPLDILRNKCAVIYLWKYSSEGIFSVFFMPQDYGNGVTEPSWLLGMLSKRLLRSRWTFLEINVLSFICGNIVGYLLWTTLMLFNVLDHFIHRNIALCFQFQILANSTNITWQHKFPCCYLSFSVFKVWGSSSTQWWFRWVRSYHTGSEIFCCTSQTPRVSAHTHTHIHACTHIRKLMI